MNRMPGFDINGTTVWGDAGWASGLAAVEAQWPTVRSRRRPEVKCHKVVVDLDFGLAGCGGTLWGRTGKDEEQDAEEENSTEL